MATKEAVFSLRVDTGNSVQDIQNADKAVKNFNKDLKETQATAASGTGVNKMQADLQALNAKIKAGGMSMQEMNRVMKDYQSIAIQAGATSPIGKEAMANAANLKDQIGDISARTKLLSSDTVKLDTAMAGLQTGVGIFQGIQGAAALAGIENKDLQKTMIKLQATQGIMNAVNTVANALNKDAILGIQLRNGLEKVKQFLMRDTTTAAIEQAAGEGVLATSTVATATATTAATTAMKIFKTALIGTGIGALIVGLGYLVSNLESVGNFLGFTSAKQKELEEQTKKAAAAAVEQRDKIASESSEFVNLIYQIKQTNANSKERKTLMKQANETYGLTLKNLSDETAFQAQLNLAVKDYIEVQKSRFKIEANKEKFQELMKKEAAIQEKLVAIGIQQQSMQKGSAAYSNIEFGIRAQTNLQLKEVNNEMASLAQNDIQLKGTQDKLTEGGKKYVPVLKDIKTNTDLNTDAVKNQNEALQKSLSILKDKLARDIEATESAEDLKIAMMAEGKSKQLAILEETYGDFRDNLIKKSNKTELDALDEKFKTGKIKEEDYRKELALIMETGSKNFSDAENNLMTLTTEKLNDGKRRLNLTAQELEIDDINKSFDQKDITEAERLIKIQEINNKYLKIQLDKDAENETKRKNRAKLLNAILLNETQLAIQNEINLFEEQAKELDKLLLSENENEKITQEEHDKAMIELEKKKVKAIEDINKKATKTSVEATKKSREEELKGISAGIAKAEDALDKIKMVNDLLNEIGTARINKINKERDEDLENLDAKQQAELSAEGLTAEQKTGIEEKFAKQKYAVQLDAFNKEDKINRAKFNRDKAIKLAEVGINTASAIVKGIAEFGPPPSPAGIAAILSAGIIGTTQALAITNQKYQGGTMPTMPSVSSSGGGGLAGSSASSFTSQPTTQTSTTGLTDGQTVTPVQVFVLENDISSTQNKVAVQESKSSF
jgi:hypothetical protein